MPPMSSRALRSALEEVAINTETLQGLPTDLAATRSELSTEVRRYLAPRLGQPPERLVVAVVGPSGVGKSALVNDIAGQKVSEEGALRPTTTTPVTVTGMVSEADRSGSGSSLRRPRYVESTTLQKLVVIDMPAAAPVGRIRPADLALVTVSPERYADAEVWSLVRGLDALGVATWMVMNRCHGRGDEAVEDLQTMTKDIGVDIPVFAIADRQRVPAHMIDDGLAELKRALVNAGITAAEMAWKSVVRRAGAVVSLADDFAAEVELLRQERLRLESAVVAGFDPANHAAASLAGSGELAAKAEQDWKETADEIADRVMSDLAIAVAVVAAAWRETELGAALLDSSHGHDLAVLPDSSHNHVRQQLIGWRDELSRNVRAKLKGNPRRAKIDELVGAARIQALGGTVKLGWFARRRLTAPVDELAAEARRRLEQTLATLADHDAARFVKQLGPGPTDVEIASLAGSVERLDTLLRSSGG